MHEGPAAGLVVSVVDPHPGEQLLIDVQHLVERLFS
jgi:hypothetical protein